MGEVLLVTAFDVFEADVLDGIKMETLPLEPIAFLAAGRCMLNQQALCGTHRPKRVRALAFKGCG
ncbi:MAG: hypothetical protein WB014_14165 [Methanosarcina sp.]